MIRPDGREAPKRGAIRGRAIHWVMGAARYEVEPLAAEWRRKGFKASVSRRLVKAGGLELSVWVLVVRERVAK